jgi:hypothetical protein
MPVSIPEIQYDRLKQKAKVVPSRIGRRHADFAPVGKPDRMLTAQEEAFVRHVANGLPLWRCWQLASGSTAGREGLGKVGNRVLARPAVHFAVIQARKKLTEDEALTRAEKRIILSTIARDGEQKASDRTGAIALDNRMTGDDDSAGRLGAGARVTITLELFQGKAVNPADEAQNVTGTA